MVIRPSRVPRQGGGVTPATAALARALRALGARDPATGEPFDEPLLFGAGGGIGATYALQELPSFVRVQVSGWPRLSRPGDAIELAARRLGFAVMSRTSATPAAAEKALRAPLASGRPVIATVDQALLPTSWLPREAVGTTPQPVLVTLENGAPSITDLGPHPFPWSWAELATARARVRGERYRLIVLGPGQRPADSAAAARAGIEDSVRAMLTPPDESGGLPALNTWLRMLRSRQDPASWEILLERPARLIVSLIWINHFIEVAGTGGGNYRPLFARFLKEAAGLLGNRRLREVAGLYHALGRRWTALVRQAMPDTVPELHRVRALGERKRRLLAEEGGTAIPRLAEIAAARWTVFSTAGVKGLPPRLGPVRPFLDGLADALEGIVAAETEAIHALAEVAGVAIG